MNLQKHQTLYSKKLYMGNDRPFTGEYREVQVLKYTPESSFEVHLTDGFRILHIKYLTTKREVVDLLKKFRTANS